MVFIISVAFCIISSLVSKRDPFSDVFNFWNNQKSQGVMSREQGGWRTTAISCLAKKCWINWDECAGALSWCSCQFFAVHMSVFCVAWAESLLNPTSWAASRTVERRSAITKFRTLSTTAALRVVWGLPERWLLFADVRPSSNRLNHS